MDYRSRKARIEFSPKQIPPTLAFKDAAAQWMKIVQVTTVTGYWPMRRQHEHE
jgi:hypothetical protein